MLTGSTIESNCEEHSKSIKEPRIAAEHLTYTYRMRVRLRSLTFLVARRLSRKIPPRHRSRGNTMYRETRVGRGEGTEGFSRVQEARRKPGVQVGRGERNFVESRDH